VTQYWGGTGTQAAVVVRGDSAAHHLGDGAVNRALEELGVPAGPDGDAWAHVRLNRFRSNAALSKGTPS